MPMTTSDKTIFVNELYNIMSENQIFMTYLGDITPDITNSLIKAVKYDNSNFTHGPAAKKKIYKVIVESLENVCKHAVRLEKELRPAIFLIGKNEDAYHVITGNYLYQEEIPPFNKLLGEINTLSREEIKARYNNILLNGEISDKDGAGLGLLDILLKSNGKLDYEFIHIQDNLSFYVLKVKVDA